MHRYRGRRSWRLPPLAGSRHLRHEPDVERAPPLAQHLPGSSRSARAACAGAAAAAVRPACGSATCGVAAAGRLAACRLLVCRHGRCHRAATCEHARWQSGGQMKRRCCHWAVCSCAAAVSAAGCGTATQQLFLCSCGVRPCRPKSNRIESD